MREFHLRSLEMCTPKYLGGGGQAAIKSRLPDGQVLLKTLCQSL